jgi:hypothetical protein
MEADVHTFGHSYSNSSIPQHASAHALCLYGLPSVCTYTAVLQLLCCAVSTASLSRQLLWMLPSYEPVRTTEK